jgi:hypothetical protein
MKGGRLNIGLNIALQALCSQSQKSALAGRRNRHANSPKPRSGPMAHESASGHTVFTHCAKDGMHNTTLCHLYSRLDFHQMLPEPHRLRSKWPARFKQTSAAFSQHCIQIHSKPY